VPAFASPGGQTRLALSNVGNALQAAGADWTDVVKLSFFVVDVSALAVVRALRDEFIDTTRPPTSSLVQVAGLFRPELLIEVKAVAWLPWPRSTGAAAYRRERCHRPPGPTLGSPRGQTVRLGVCPGCVGGRGVPARFGTR
jgi:hypothetical protein